MKLPKAKAENIVVQVLNDETLIYNLTTNQAFCLNDTAAKVFNHCDGAMTFDELKSQHQLADELIYLALDELKKENLVADGYISPFVGMNRRDVIRKAGLASLVALPVIASLVAPTAVSAASPSACPACTVSLPLGQTCSAGGSGCPASNQLGYNSTPCPNNCQLCACTIINGRNSCDSICST